MPKFKISICNLHLRKWGSWLRAPARITRPIWLPWFSRKIHISAITIFKIIWPIWMAQMMGKIWVQTELDRKFNLQNKFRRWEFLHSRNKAFLYTTRMPLKAWNWMSFTLKLRTTVNFLMKIIRNQTIIKAIKIRWTMNWLHWPVQSRITQVSPITLQIWE